MLNDALKSFMATLLLFLGFSYLFKDFVFSRIPTKPKLANNATTFDEYRLILSDNFSISKKDNCDYKGILAIQRENFEFFAFHSNNSQYFSKSYFSMKRCYEIAKELNKNLTREDFCRNYTFMNFEGSSFCRELRNIVKFKLPKKYQNKIFLYTGRVEGYVIWALVPQNPCEIYKIENFMHEILDKVSVMFNKDLQDQDALESHELTRLQEGFINNSSLAYHKKVILSGPKTLLYLILQHIRCADPKILPENIKNDINNIESKNYNGCFAFDLEYKNFNKIQNIFLSFAGKENAKFDMDAPFSELYFLESVYINMDIVFGNNFSEEVMAENKINKNEPDCDNTIDFEN